MIRQYESTDFPVLRSLLAAEGLSDSDMGFDKYPTFVYDDGVIKGFYTYKMEYGIFPHLQHFCVGPEYRAGAPSLRLISNFRKRMRGYSYKKAIINCPTSKGEVSRLIARYFRLSQEYACQDQHKFFLVSL